MRVIRLEMNARIIDKKNRFDGVGNSGKDFIYGDQE